MPPSSSRAAPSRSGGRIVSGPASAGGRSDRTHKTLLDLTEPERQHLDETFALALQGRRTRTRRASSSSTDGPSAAEISRRLSNLKQEPRGKKAAAIRSSDADDSDAIDPTMAAQKLALEQTASLLGSTMAASRAGRSPPRLPSAFSQPERPPITGVSKPPSRTPSRPPSRQHGAFRAGRDAGRMSRAASSSGQSTMSRPVDPSKVARNLRRIMALTSSSDDSDTSTDNQSVISGWRPSPRAVGTTPALRRWGYQQIPVFIRKQEETLPPPVVMKNGYSSSPEARHTDMRPPDAYTAPMSRFPRIWPLKESDAEPPLFRRSARPSTMRSQSRRPQHYDTDLEKGLQAAASEQTHTRSHSLPTKPLYRSDLPFHERPFPRARRMTRTIASSAGYFSDNGISSSRPPSAMAMMPPPSVQDKPGRLRRSQKAPQTASRTAQSVPASPVKAPDEFAHMVLPPSFSPRPSEGIPPYFPLLAAAPNSVQSGWTKWLSYGSPRAHRAAAIPVGEVRRSAKAEAAHRLGVDLLSPSTGLSSGVRTTDENGRALSRKEAKLAAAAAAASGSSAAARAYHMFAKRAYEKMGKSTSVPSALESSAPPAGNESSVQDNAQVPKSTSAPADLVTQARTNDKVAQLDKTLTEIAHKYPDQSEPLSDADLNTTPQLLHDGTPIPTDFPSDTDPNLTPSDDAAPQSRRRHAPPSRDTIGTFRVLKRPVQEKIAPILPENPTLRLVTQPNSKEEGEDDVYAKLLFDWDGMDEYSEDDDDMHDPGKPIKRSCSPWRMLMNIGGLLITVLALLALLAALPIAMEVIKIYNQHHAPPPNITEATVSGIENLRWTIIDPDTPRSALHRMGGLDGQTQYNLVFSDEFNQDERIFEPGMDPWWEAVDLWYWGTGDLERYNSRQVTTSGGALRIKLEERPLGGLNFRSGMLQSWNKLCMNGAGYLEVSVQLPGYANVSGLWPSIFTLGNLGRAGYGSTLEGMWPYSYNTCDVGTLTNQTTTDGYPASAATGGNTTYNRKHDTTAISFLPGQKLSACTCPQDDHPGPRLPGDDGQTYAVGRSVPEIDLFEAQVSSSGVMGVSQSVQMAPFNYLYRVSNSSGPAFTVFNNESSINGYDGEVTQQSISFVTPTIQGTVQHPAPNAATRAPPGAIQGRPGYAVYGYEVEPGPQGYLQWTAGGAPSWRLNAAAFDPDPISGIGRRVFSEEPMSIIMNLAISSAWSQPDWDNLSFPAIMSIDYVRLYAPASMDPNLAITCDPPNAPTYDYIQRHAVAYNNPNLTIWGGTAKVGGYEQNWPRNSLQPEGCRAPKSVYPGSPIDPIGKAPYVPPNEIAP